MRNTCSTFALTDAVLFVPLALRGRQLPVALGLVQHRPVHTSLSCCLLNLVVVIPFVAKHRAVVLPDQFADDAAVVVARRGDADGVDEAAVGIDTDMGFHAKMPGVAFLGRTHLRVALLGLALATAAHG